MIKKIFIILSLYIASISHIEALYIKPEMNNIYNNFVKNIENTYDLEKQSELLLSLEIKLNKYKNSTKYKNNNRVQEALEQFLYLNDQKLINIRKELILKTLKDSDFNNYDYSFVDEIENSREIIEKYDYSKYFKNISYTKNQIFLED